jgi:hypothetical protein
VTFDKQGSLAALEQAGGTTTRAQGAEIPPLKFALRQSIHRVSILSGEEPGTLNSELAEVQPIPATPLSIAAGVPSALLLRRRWYCGRIARSGSGI